MLSHDLVALDFVGTLATLSPSNEELVSDFLDSVSQPRSGTQISSALAAASIAHHYSSVSVTTRLARKEFLLKNNQEVLRILSVEASPESLFSWFEAVDRHWELANGASRECLIEISESSKRMVIASNFDSTLSRILQRLGVLDLFHYVYASQIMGIEKPSVEFYRAIGALESVEPDRCLMVGDSYHLDYAPAVKAGWSARLITFDELPGLAVSPAVRVASFPELAASLRAEGMGSV